MDDSYSQVVTLYVYAKCTKNTPVVIIGESNILITKTVHELMTKSHVQRRGQGL